MKRIIATLLAVFMLVGVMNIAAFAEEASGGGASVPGSSGGASVPGSSGAVPSVPGEGLEPEEPETVDPPTATITEIDVHALEAEEVYLTYALNFSADEVSPETLAAYGDWYVDFVLTINKNATFNANGEADGYLAGQYDAWSDAWVLVPFEDTAIVADEPVKIMEAAADMMGEPGLQYRYSEVYEIVQDFDCGVYFSDEFLLANPDLVTTLELRMYNPENLEESYSCGNVYEFKVVASTTEENVVVQGTKVTGNAVEIHDVNADEIADGTTSVTIDTNEFVDNSEPDAVAVVETVKLPAAAIETVEALGDDATLNITLANSEEEEDTTVVINKDALTAIAEAADAEGAETLTLKVEKTDELEAEQESAIEDLDNTTVYRISLETEDGTPVYAATDADDEREIVIKIYYRKSGAGRKVHVKHLKDDGTLEEVDFDYENNVITMNLAHFSEYVVYETRLSSGNIQTSSGSTTVPQYTIRFVTNGGSAVATVKVDKDATLAEPAAPTKEGYTFEGWYTDEAFETAYDFATPVTKGFTLYAKWAEAAEEPSTDEPSTDEPVEAATFTDVKAEDWFSADVKFVSENGLMNGVSETEFAPDALLTRAMLVTILYRNEGEPATNRSIPFADIDMSAYYASAVIWAQQNGIVNGVTETEFAPDANITREQIAAIMFRYAVYKGMEAVTLEENLIAFADADEINEYAISALNWAVGSGLINGKTESTLCPQDNATRAEIAAILHRYIAAQK